jgi:hypothetical protein
MISFFFDSVSYASLDTVLCAVLGSFMISSDVMKYTELEILKLFHLPSAISQIGIISRSGFFSVKILSIAGANLVGIKDLCKVQYITLLLLSLTLVKDI